MNLDSEFWCGTERSLEAYMAVLKTRSTRDLTTLPAVKAAYGDVLVSGGQSQEKEVPRLFSQIGNVGVVQISGPLTNNPSPWDKYDGITAYSDIREAMIHAALEPSVGAIVMDYTSGGGAVSGVSDTADLIAKIDSQVKPVHTFSDSVMASAAYWLGSSARSVDIGKVAEVGSIGIISVHMEKSQMMADMGVGVTVFRAGEFKGLGNGYEKLTDPGKKVIQGQLDQMYGLFMGYVAPARKMDYASADASFGQGRVFIGASAVQAGLADSITSFDALVSKAQGAIDSQKKIPQYGANLLKGSPVKTALTEQQISAMAESGALGQPTGTEKTPAQTAALAAQATLDKQASDAAAAKLAEDAKPKLEASTDLNAFLKTSLTEAQASITDLTIQLRDAKLSASTSGTDILALRAYAEGVGDRMKIALGGSAGGYDGMSASALVAQNNALRERCEKDFKVGGVAAISSSGAAQDKEAAVDPARQARIAATRIAK